MSFEWSDDLATGVSDIDSQHRELISRLNRLIASCTGGSDTGEVGRYLEFLREYIAFHFAAEEREMTGHRYPKLAEHEAEHELFKKRVNAICRSHAEHGAGIAVLLMTIQSSGDWLLNHIQGTDREMAAYLKGKR
jgi:hemerythrin